MESGSRDTEGADPENGDRLIRRYWDGICYVPMRRIEAVGLNNGVVRVMEVDDEQIERTENAAQIDSTYSEEVARLRIRLGELVNSLRNALAREDRANKKIEALNKENEQLNNQLKASRSCIIAQENVVPLKKPTKPFFSLTQRRQTDIVKEIVAALGTVFGATSGSDWELFCKAICDKLKPGNDSPPSKLSSFDALVYLRKYDISWLRLADMKRFFKAKIATDPFPSLDSIHKCAKELSVIDRYGGSIVTAQDDKGNDMEITTVTLKDVKLSVEERLQALHDSSQLEMDEIKDEIWLSVVGDKGGSTTKLCISVGNVKKSNSRQNLIIVGVCSAEDKSYVMKACFADQIAQINNLKSVDIIIDGVVRNFPVKWFLSGDMMFLYECLGHKGPSATFPCFYCYANNLKKGISSYQSCSAMRSTKTFVTDASTGRYSVRKDSTLLFPIIPIENIVPPSLHIMMGVSKYAIDALDNCAIREDSPNGMPATRKEQKKRLAIVKSDVDNLEKTLNTFKTLKSDCIATQAIFEAIRDRKIIAPHNDPVLCKAQDSCIFRDARANSLSFCDWIECSMCKCFSHHHCTGILSKDREILTNGDFTCFSCEGYTITQRIDDAKTELGNIEIDIRNTENALSKAKNECHELETVINSSTGAKGRELEQIFKECGADRLAFFQQFTGNHTMNLLQPGNAAKLWALFEPNPSNQAFEQFMVTLSSIQSFAKSSFIPLDEVESLSNLMIELLQSLQTADPAATVTPKLHILVEHVVPFVQLHGTWGKLSEQPIEALHAYFNSVMRKFLPVRNTMRRISMMSFRGRGGYRGYNGVPYYAANNNPYDGREDAERRRRRDAERETARWMRKYGELEAESRSTTRRADRLETENVELKKDLDTTKRALDDLRSTYDIISTFLQENMIKFDAQVRKIVTLLLKKHEVAVAPAQQHPAESNE